MFRRLRPPVGSHRVRVAVASFLAVRAALPLSSAPHAAGIAPPDAAPDGSVRTVVLVSVDTLRRDAVGFFSGRTPSPTPFLDELAARGVAFDDAVAPVPLTGPSHWSMMTGRWPWHEGVRLNSFAPHVEGTRTLAEHLGEAGWITGAFVSCFVLDGRFGFARGFDRYDARMGSSPSGREFPERAGRETVRAALAWVRERDSAERVFLWVHLFEPHHPHPPAREELSGPHGDYLTDVYEADRQLAALADGLAAEGRPGNHSLWIVISDHGEGLGEHGEATHGLLLHGATTRIPLVFAGPDRVPERRGTLASTPDLLPTLLAWLDLPAVPCDGVDLFAPATPGDRAIPLESWFGAMAFGLAPAVGLRTRDWLWESSPDDHLWNVTADPREESDRAASRPDQVAEMGAAREAFGVPDIAPRPALDDESLAKLEALGYVGSGSRVEAIGGDVRAFANEGFHRTVQIDSLVSGRRFDEAEARTRAFLRAYPRSTTMWFTAAMISLERGRLEEAEERLRTVLELQPTYEDARVNLGNVLASRGRLPQAEKTYREVLERDPANLPALFNLATLLTRERRAADAARFWDRIIELYPDHPQAAVAREHLSVRKSPFVRP